jgi:hypothetical protein
MRQIPNAVKRKRAILTVLLLPAFVVLASLWYGVRVALFGAQAAEIERLMALWGGVMLVLGILLGIVFIFKAPRNPGYWQVVLVSALWGGLSLPLLYPRLPANALAAIARPVEDPTFDTPVRLVLAGGVDGLALGAVIGLCTLVVDPHLALTRPSGWRRYFALTGLVAALIVGSMALNELGGFWDVAANLIPLSAIALLRFVVMQRDKRRERKA